MKTDLKSAIKKIAKKYSVILVSCVGNIQGTFDVQLNQRIYPSQETRMENEIRKLGNINDIFYHED